MEKPNKKAPKWFWHAWYSSEALRDGFACQFKDADGNTVTVTEVTKDSKPFRNYRDYEYRGLVRVGSSYSSDCTLFK
jgi:hypothetical protein